MTALELLHQLLQLLADNFLAVGVGNSLRRRLAPRNHLLVIEQLVQIVNQLLLLEGVRLHADAVALLGDSLGVVKPDGDKNNEISFDEKVKNETTKLTGQQRAASQSSACPC